MRFERLEFNHLANDYVKDLQVSVSKYNRTSYIVSGSGILTKPFNDEFSLRYEIFGMQGNEYRKVIPDFVKNKMCTFFKESNLIYNTIVPFSNIPPQSNNMCPWEPKKYWIKEYLGNIGGVQSVPFGMKFIKIQFTYYHLKVVEISGAIYLEVDYTLI